MEQLQLLQNLNTFQPEELRDFRKALVKQTRTLEECVKNILRFNDEIFDVVRYAETLRHEHQVVKVGVYEIRKKNQNPKLIYHIVSDENYNFEENINTCWFLVNEYELELNKPLQINRFIIDFNYWLSVNAY